MRKLIVSRSVSSNPTEILRSQNGYAAIKNASIVFAYSLEKYHKFSNNRPRTIIYLKVPKKGRAIIYGGGDYLRKAIVNSKISKVEGGDFLGVRLFEGDATI